MTYSADSALPTVTITPEGDNYYLVLDTGAVGFADTPTLASVYAERLRASHRHVYHALSQRMHADGLKYVTRFISELAPILPANLKSCVFTTEDMLYLCMQICTNVMQRLLEDLAPETAPTEGSCLNLKLKP